MGLLRVDALNLIARRLKSQGPLGTLRRYWQKASYQRQGLPIYLMIEPASVCNLRCPYCSVLQTSELLPTGVMDLARYKDLLDQITSRPGYRPPLDLFYRGEPLVNPHFAEMAGYAKAKGLTVGTSTNAVLLTAGTREAILDSGLDVMIVSFDGATKESYEVHRVGAVFEKVVDRLTRFIAQRKARGLKKPLIDLQFIVTKKNQAEIPLIKELGQRMGVDQVSLKSIRVPLMDRPQEEALALGKELLPDQEAYRKDMVDEVKIGVFNVLPPEGGKIRPESLEGGPDLVGGQGEAQGELEPEPDPGKDEQGQEEKGQIGPDPVSHFLVGPLPLALARARRPAWWGRRQCPEPRPR